MAAIIKKCPKCTVEFYCENSISCWCDKEPFMGGMMPEYDDRYVSCMCPRCLEEFRNTFYHD